MSIAGRIAAARQVATAPARARPAREHRVASAGRPGRGAQRYGVPGGFRPVKASAVGAEAVEHDDRGAVRPLWGSDASRRRLVHPLLHAGNWSAGRDGPPR
ncbi:hypothetical protein Acel_0977 [Acidothermus cellulolyticus 11B]|uniref:Uncharacterized protein n=1 Tax=Acidothermus cellulolyticus (strain ATCC 43068 / DSM 8971 / 11B) TaxID=351607 RepID=A0LTJ0_ACIC1|nr:hypothetical protein Acel_0977 [Acidothermus cellulolyticus 11B]